MAPRAQGSRRAPAQTERLHEFGKAGRKTGITLPTPDALDEYGMAPVDDVFQSPEKPTANGRAVAVSDDEDDDDDVESEEEESDNDGGEAMDIDNSTAPDPVSVLRNSSHNRPRLPPPRLESRSPGRSFLQSPARRLSAFRPGQSPQSSPAAQHLSVLQQGSPRRLGKAQSPVDSLFKSLSQPQMPSQSAHMKKSAGLRTEEEPPSLSQPEPPTRSGYGSKHAAVTLDGKANGKQVAAAPAPSRYWSSFVDIDAVDDDGEDSDGDDVALDALWDSPDLGLHMAPEDEGPASEPEVETEREPVAGVPEDDDDDEVEEVAPVKPRKRGRPLTKNKDKSSTAGPTGRSLGIAAKRRRSGGLPNGSRNDNHADAGESDEGDEEEEAQEEQEETERARKKARTTAATMSVAKTTAAAASSRAPAAGPKSKTRKHPSVAEPNAAAVEESQSQRGPAKGRRGRKPTGTNGHGPTATDGIEDTSMIVPRGPPLPKSRGLVITRRETPGVDGSDIVRTRSGRNSYRPLAFWRNEHVDYDQDATVEDAFGSRSGPGPKFVLPTIKEVHRVDEPEPAPRASKPQGRRAARKKKKRQKSLDDGDGDDDDDSEPEHWETERGFVTGPAVAWDPSFERHPPAAGAAAPEVEETLAVSGGALELRPVRDGNFRYIRVVSTDFFGTGLIELPPGAEKRRKNARKMVLAFCVLQGRVCVTVNRSTFRMRRGGMWCVPRGNFYSITNDYDQLARVFYSQGCEVAAPAIESGEDVSTG